MTEPAALPLDRTTARVLLLDADDRLLLFHGVDPHVPDVTFWFTPGGGVEPGEGLEEAARRELAEETGCTEVQLEGPAWTRTAEFSFEGEAIRSFETFYVARVPAWDVDTRGFTDLERRAVHAHRWWRLDELEGTADLVYPTELPRLLGLLLREGVPGRPIEVGT
jgi:ADP-ribose pyrophosphatase YjhB (NUDIX family)